MADLDRAYAERTARAVDRQLELDRMAAAKAAECSECRSRRECVPSEIQLRQLMSEAGLETEKFVPRAGTGEQKAALAAYAHAVTLMVDAFGVEIAGARVNKTWGLLRVFAQLRRIMDRVDAARRPIQDDLRARYDRGELCAAEVNDLARTTPTPDYEGRDRDEAWLQRVLGAGVDAI